ncbi:hypothetical protein PtrM4_127130 [Pyrenophora tritici-repentis]|uniref:Uncharacterized protein n=1 Tax=Pyrenophora tritici-repentis TaxID=45151 RepID=A0A834RPU9_9PLEO|nr:hypothetical protein PtrM4_127130 [Pyrenophora tritici-repentis]
MNFKYVELMFLATKPTRSRWLKVFRETPISGALASNPAIYFDPLSPRGVTR